jgi:hypothetical protein
LQQALEWDQEVAVFKHTFNRPEILVEYKEHINAAIKDLAWLGKIEVAITGTRKLLLDMVVFTDIYFAGQSLQDLRKAYQQLM